MVWYGKCEFIVAHCYKVTNALILSSILQCKLVAAIFGGKLFGESVFLSASAAPVVWTACSLPNFRWHSFSLPRRDGQAEFNPEGSLNTRTVQSPIPVLTGPDTACGT